MNEPSLVRGDTQSCVCPRCGRITTYRVKRGKVMRLVSIIADFKRFWCPNCHRRFYTRLAKNS